MGVGTKALIGGFPILACLLIGSVQVVTSQHVIEIQVYVDLAAQQNWRRVTGKTRDNDLKSEITSILSESAEALGSIPNLNLKMKIKGLTLMRNNVVADNNEFNSRTTLNGFKQYLREGRKDIGDLALLYTKFSEPVLEKGEEYTKGRASIYTVCHVNGSGVVELDMTSTDIIMTSHEIAHILGAQHDRTQEKGGYIMAPSVLSASPNRFFFSNYTASQIKDRIDILNKDRNNCLTNGRYGYLSAPKLGSLLSIDELCTRSKGRAAYLARGSYSHAGYGDNVCGEIKCSFLDDIDGNYTLVYGYDGIDCGHNKKCVHGRCVANARGANPDITDVCPFGDQPVINYNFVRVKSCNDLKSKDDCFPWQMECCTTCAKFD